MAVHQAWIEVEGTELRLAELRYGERLSAACTGMVRLGEGLRWPGAELPLSATVRVAARRIPVLVRGCRRGYASDALELVDPTLPLALRAMPRRFRDASVRDIVDEVARGAGLAARWQLGEAPRPLPYVVQSGETDLAFVTCLLAMHGAYFHVDDDGALVVSDCSRDAPVVIEAELFHSEGALQRAAGVFELFRGARVAPGRATVADYDWKRPLLVLTASSVAERDSDCEQYLWPAGFRDPHDGLGLAHKRLEALRALAEYAEGRSTLPELGAGRRLSLRGEDEWFVVEVEHRFHEHEGYENRFVATPREVAYRPPVPRAPPVGGLESAMARGPAGTDIHTDAHGRFKAEMPWDADAQQTDEGARWVRLLQECSSSMCLARSGWEMLLAYVDGDPARPVGLGRAMHKHMPPSYAQPAFAGAMTMRTRSSPQDGASGSELSMSDNRGGQRIELVAQRDLATLVKHDQSVRIGRDASETVGADRTLAVRGNRSVTIAGERSSHVHGDAQEAVGGALTRSVGAGESISVKQSHGESAQSDEERVGAVRITIDGGIASPADIAKRLIPDPKRALAGALGAAAGDVTGAVAQIKQTATAPRDAVLGLASPPNLSSGVSPLDSLTGRLEQVRNSVAGLGALPSMASDLPGKLGSFDPGQAFDNAKAHLASTLQGAIPSLSSIANALPTGEISKKSGGRFSRRVGGAFVSVSVGNISEKALFAHAEMVGGVRLKLTPRTVATSVAGPLTLLVGGTLLRASRAMSITSLHAKVTAGAAIRVKADGPLTIRGDQVLLRSKMSLRMSVGDTAVELSRSALAIQGDLLTDAPVVEVTGDEVDLTKG